MVKISDGEDARPPALVCSALSATHVSGGRPTALGQAITYDVVGCCVSVIFWAMWVLDRQALTKPLGYCQH